MFARALLMVTLVALSGPGQAATVRELGAAELRQAVGSGAILSPKRVLDVVVRSTGGEPIEARPAGPGERQRPPQRHHPGHDF